MPPLLAQALIGAIRCTAIPLQDGTPLANVSITDPEPFIYLRVVKDKCGPALRGRGRGSSAWALILAVGRRLCGGAGALAVGRGL